MTTKPRLVLHVPPFRPTPLPPSRENFCALIECVEGLLARAEADAHLLAQDFVPLSLQRYNASMLFPHYAGSKIAALTAYVSVLNARTLGIHGVQLRILDWLKWLYSVEGDKKRDDAFRKLREMSWELDKSKLECRRVMGRAIRQREFCRAVVQGREDPAALLGCAPVDCTFTVEEALDKGRRAREQRM